MEIIQISKKDLEGIGSAYLFGRIAKHFNMVIPKDAVIRFEFEQSSLDYRRDHGGPDEIILTEYAPMCLCEDIINLMKQGYNIEIGEYSPLT